MNRHFCIQPPPLASHQPWILTTTMLASVRASARAEFSGFQAASRQVVYLWDRQWFHGCCWEYAVGEFWIYPVVCTCHPHSPRWGRGWSERLIHACSARFISRSCLKRLGLRFMGKPSFRTLVGVSRIVRLWGSSRMLRLLGGPFSSLYSILLPCGELTR
jgi:hypothetical protein